MADPTGYDRDYSFSGFQANAPATPLPGQQVDIQFDKVSASITTIVDAIRDVRRSDGKLRNGIVTAESLSQDLALGVRPPTEWQAGVEYKAGDTVFAGIGFYRALADHVSTDFAANLAAGLWELFADMSQIIANAEIQPDQLVGSAAFGRSLLSLVDAAAARAAIGAVNKVGDTITGNLAVGGEFTYGKAKNISGTDLDTLTTPGFYDGNNLANAPNGNSGWFYIDVQRHSQNNNYVYQRATALDHSNNATWVRNRAGGVWQPWRQDMVASVYDPRGVSGDAFNMDNMVEGASNKILTAAEREKIADVASRLIDTRTLVTTTSIPTETTYIRTAGYYTPGDGGGALYKRVSSEPTHAGKVRSADGAWWELVAEGSVSVLCFGADISGATDSLASINSAVTFATLKGVGLRVPDGTINLSADVTAPGNIEWFFGPSVVVTGAGKFPMYGGSNAGYRRPNETRNAIVVGSRDTPVSDVKSGISSTLYSSAGPGFGPRAAVVGYTEKWTTVNDAGAVGGFFEADDMVGWTNSGEGSNNFVEGVRAHGVVTNTAPNGSAYGVVAAALSSGNTTPKYLVGVESDNRKNGGSHAPEPKLLNKDSMSVGFLASCAGTYRSDAAFMVNPHNSQKFAAGLYIPANTVQDRAIFIDSDTAVSIEIAGAPSFSAISIPNAAPIRGANATNTMQLYLIGVTPENGIRIGQTDASALILAIPGLGERIVSYGEPDSAGPGFRTLRVAN